MADGIDAEVVAALGDHAGDRGRRYFDQHAVDVAHEMGEHAACGSVVHDAEATASTCRRGAGGELEVHGVAVGVVAEVSLAATGDARRSVGAGDARGPRQSETASSTPCTWRALMAGPRRGC